jgi:hypothetical protein
VKPPITTWTIAVVGQAIEGASDAFLIVAGGSAALQTTSAPPIDLKHILTSMGFGAAIYVASYLKKFPTPSSLPVNPPSP